MHCHAIHPGAGALAPRTHHARLGSGVTGVSLSAGAASPRTGLWSTDVGSRRPSAQRRSTSVPYTQRSAGLRVQATPTASPHDVVLSAACVKYSKVELCTQAATLPYPCTHVPIEEEDPQLLCVQCLLPLLLMLPLLLPLLPLPLPLLPVAKARSARRRLPMGHRCCRCLAA